MMVRLGISSRGVAPAPGRYRGNNHWLNGWKRREAFKRISIPLVRRIYPALTANKIVSVQPLVAPALMWLLRRVKSQRD